MKIETLPADEETARIVVVGITEVVAVVELTLVIIGIGTQRVVGVLPKIYLSPSKSTETIATCYQLLYFIWSRFGHWRKARSVFISSACALPIYKLTDSDAIKETKDFGGLDP